ncbi:MAG: hypothetical protein K2X27_10500 [Candidatus Obscuribacterales bacterium]|nr:hypothetical protein [Candidatus Obscuribacterales bacterium]
MRRQEADLSETSSKCGAEPVPKISSSLLLLALVLCFNSAVQAADGTQLKAPQSHAATTVGKGAEKKEAPDPAMKSTTSNEIGAAGKPPGKGSAVAKSPDKALPDKKEPSKKSEKNNLSAAPKKNSSSVKRQGMLVPPPPPSVPTLTDSGMNGYSQMIFIGENVEMMPASDLADLKEKTSQEIARSRRNVEELAGNAGEKRNRAATFDQLFAEGVVSRRELETSKHDCEKIEEDLADAKQGLTALEQKFGRIEKRLADLKRAKKNPAQKNRKH